MVEVQDDHAEMLITHTTDIVVSFVSNNSVAADDVSALIKSVHATLSGLGAGGETAEVRPDPAVSIRSSV
jgi:predicted transcriptional regulator